MRKNDALEFFGNSPSELAKAIGVTVSAVNQWGADVPLSRRASVRMAMRERAEKLEAQALVLRSAAKELEQ